MSEPIMRPWSPMERSSFSQAEQARKAKLIAKYGTNGEEKDYPPENEVWLSEDYQCVVTYLEDDRDGMCHLSIKRTNRRPAHDWRDLQAIKNEILGPEREAVNIHPAESRLVDAGDQTHLWVFPVGYRIPIGFSEREVLTDHERKLKLAAVDPEAAAKGSQRNWRPGIPTGAGLEEK